MKTHQKLTVMIKRIIEILNKHAIKVDNWNNAVFQEQFDNVAKLIIELVDINKDKVKVKVKVICDSIGKHSECGNCGAAKLHNKKHCEPCPFVPSAKCKKPLTLNK